MPSYIVRSEGPIQVKKVERPDWELPDWRPGSPDIGLPGEPEVPDTGGPGRPTLPPIPPRDEWPPLPPLPELPPDWRERLEEYLGSLSPEHPWVPIPGGPEVEPPPVWPPINIPDLPDFSGKTLALALVYVSRRVAKWRWVLIDHEKTKDRIQKIKDHIKDKLPAGGVGGRPPERPQPGTPGAQPR